jgi:hypothetical protein
MRCKRYLRDRASAFIASGFVSSKSSHILHPLRDDFLLRKWAVFCSILMLALVPPSPTRATVITYEATNLPDPVQGMDLWRYTYRVSDFVFSQGQGFSIFFSPNLYRGLQYPPPAPNADWNVISLQPDLALSSSGIFDGQALINGASLNDPFTVEFIWLGSGTPGAQVFDIHDADFSILVQGTTVVPQPAATLANISTRLRVETGDNILIGGFIVTGPAPKKVIIRAIGPSLALADKLGNPTLELRNGAGTLLDSNDDWQQSPNKQAIIDTTIPPTQDLESAIISTLPAEGASYTAIVRGLNNATGIAVVEVYDLDISANSKLANISTRGFVQTGDNVLFAGTIVVGPASQKVLIRAIGPSLSGVPGKMADPNLELRDGNGALLEANDNWPDSPNKQAIIDSTIPPTNPLEAAIVRTLPAGGANYTAIVRGVNNTTGIAVMEVYALN